MLNAAKNHLESRGDTHVVGAFISPTADKFLHKKLLKNKNPADYRHKHPPNFISGTDRCNMVELMIKDSDWIMCDRYEAENNASATEGKKVIQQIVSRFYGHEVSDRPHPGALLSILNVSGIDALENIKSEYSVATVLFVVNRQQDDGKDPHEMVANHPHGAKADVVWDSEWESRDISSSMLRKLWAEGKDVSHITSPDVIQCSSGT
jgi:nicotinic acid mononucleotide adenylyltransferase